MAKAKGNGVGRTGEPPWRNRIIGYSEEDPEQLLASPYNWRVHGKAQQDALSGVLREIGLIQNVIVNKTTQHMVDGHLRVGLAISERQPTVPVTWVELTEAEEQLAIATLDPLSAMAAADREQLDSLLREIDTGEQAVQQLLADLAKSAGLEYGQEPKEAPEAQIDRAAELQEKWGTRTGDLWLIESQSVPGKCHRLLCGDSTNATDVARLMGGDRAVLFATDPPYGANAGNIGFTSQRDDIEAIKKDDLEGREMQAFLESAFRAWIPSLTDDCAWYLWHPMLTQGYFAAAAAAADLIIHRQIIWRKEQFIFGRGDYHWRHELCFYGWRQGHRPAFYGERNQDTVWDIPWGEKRASVGHPTAKPPELFAIPMRNHTLPGQVCAEPFSGSGSQMIAGEQYGRLVYACDCEPKYLAVALERLSAMSLSVRRAEG